LNPLHLNIFKAIARRIKAKTPRGYIIVDFKDNYIQLPDGTVIPRDRILHIDTQRKAIVYIDELGRIKEASYTPTQTLELKTPTEALPA